MEDVVKRFLIIIMMLVIIASIIWLVQPSAAQGEPVQNPLPTYTTYPTYTPYPTITPTPRPVLAGPIRPARSEFPKEAYREDIQLAIAAADVQLWDVLLRVGKYQAEAVMATGRPMQFAS
jgi:hypothetical protein